MFWLYKLLGYKYKIAYMKTTWKASEFQYTGAVKVLIDYPITAEALRKQLPQSWMWHWDDDSFKVIKVKSGNDLLRWKKIRGTAIYHCPKDLKKIFE